jgi:aspartate 1-decarboxylase
MLRKLLRAKIHRATITRCDLDYVGSITIDADLLAAADIRPNEAVSVFDLDNAARFETYVIRGEPGSGEIAINGAAAKLVEVGHRVIVVCFGYLQPQELDAHEAKVVLVDADNRLHKELLYPSRIEAPAVT